MPNLIQISRVTLPQPPALSIAQLLARGETEALAIGFTDRSLKVLDTGTPANDRNYAALGSLDTFSSWFTYTSPSPKMIRHSDGLLKYAAHNLLQQSETLATTWSSSAASNDGYLGAGTVCTATNAYAAGPLSNNATRLEPSLGGGTTSSDRSQRTQVSITLVSGARYRIKFWVRSTDASSSYAAVFLLTNTDTTYQAFNVTPTWTEISHLTAAATSTTGNLRIGLVGGQTPTNSNSMDILISAVQLARDPVGDGYLVTTTAARYALPLEYDASANPLGLLVETARTNLCLRSSDFTNASWTKSNITTSQTATGPGGVANSATILTASAANGTALQAITSGSAVRVTSCWIKRRTGTGNIDLTQDNGTTWTTVTVTSSWAPVALASVTSTNPTVGIRIVTSGDEIDVHSFQHEVGAYPSSPIETYAATVTRAVDNIGVATSLFPHEQVPGTLYAKWIIPNYEAGVTGRYVVTLDDGSTANRVGILAEYPFSSGVNTGIYNGGGPSGNATAANTLYKSAFAFDASDQAYVGNNLTPLTSATGGSPTGINQLRIGHSTSTPARVLAGHIQEILYLPRRMTNSDMGTLTT